MSAARGQCARFGRFSLTGLFGAALQVALFDLLINQFHLPPAGAAAIAVELVLLNNFLWHERFTWRDRPMLGAEERAVRLARFHVTNGLISLVGNAILIHCLVVQLHAPLLLSAVAAIAICAPANFLTADRWIFSGVRKRQMVEPTDRKNPAA